MTTTTATLTLPTDRHDVDIAARAAYNAYLAAWERHNAMYASLPRRLQLLRDRMVEEDYRGDYKQADVDAILEWATACRVTQDAYEAANAARAAISRRQDELADEESRQRRVDEARDDAAGRLRVVRDAELRELAAGYDAVHRLGRLEGKVADIEVLAKPYHGIKSIERDAAGRITTVLRAR